VSIALALSFLAACGGDAPNAANTGPVNCHVFDELDCASFHDVEPTLEVGTGVDGAPVFEPLSADGGLPVYYGPQGGYHAWLQARMTGLCPASVVFSRRIVDPILRFQSTRARMAASDDGWVASSAQQTFLCPTNVAGVSLVDTTVDLEVTLREDFGTCAGQPEPRSITKHVPVRIECPAGDDRCTDDFCHGCAAPPESYDCSG